MLENAETITRMFAITGKFFMAAGFSTIFLFTVELFPTVVRYVFLNIFFICLSI